MEGMARSAETVYKLIKGEMRSGIPSERIMVGGFSQGQNQGKSMPPDYDALPCFPNLRGILTVSVELLSTKQKPFFEENSSAEVVMLLLEFLIKIKQIQNSFSS